MILLDLIGGVALLLWGLHLVQSGILRPHPRSLWLTRFSEDGATEIDQFQRRVLEKLRLAFRVFLSGDIGGARKLVAENVQLRTAELTEQPAKQ
jgi:Na+/phosphate symporter